MPDRARHGEPSGQSASGLEHFSTARFGERERMPIWREVYSRNLFNLDIEAIGDEPFHADVTLRALPGANVLRGSRSASRTSITRPLLPTASDSLVLAVTTHGRGQAWQRGREEAIPVGGAILMSSAEQASHAVIDNGRLLTVVVPRDLVAPHVVDVGDALMRPFAPGLDVLRLLIGYADSAMTLSVDASPHLQTLAAAHLRDLLVLLLGAHGDARELALSRGVRAARVQSIKKAIFAGAQRADLSAETVARSLGISADYVRKLLASEDCGFSDYVMRLRLERCLATLRDPRMSHLGISAIAFAAGFSDISYFNRSFRKRFGMTPGDAREIRMP